MRVKQAAALIGAALLAVGVANAQSGAVLAERYSATTTAMTPSDVSLRFDVREWSDEAARAKVIEVLESGEADLSKALGALPTVGYVWKDGSSVGYSVKYAHRETTADGERITFVTDKRLGAYDLKPWAPSSGEATDLTYSVIELKLANGAGTGTLSLAAEVKIDREQKVVSLAEGAPQLLSNAKIEPKPYWAKKT